MSILLKAVNFNGVNGSHFELRLEYDLVQSIEYNTSTITYHLKMKSKDNYSGSGSTAHGYINKDDGDNWIWVGDFNSIGKNSTIEIGTQTNTYVHDNNGYKTIPYYAFIDTSWDIGDAYCDGTLDLPRILRYPQMTGATDFTDEENPSISFTNQGVFPVRVKMNNGNNTILYRDISQTATSYTFELTNQERNTLRTLSANSGTFPIKFVVCAMSGNTELNASWIDKTMTIVNANPTFTYTMQETNAKVITALGTNVANDIVQDTSVIQFAINTQVYKNASGIKEIQIINTSTDDRRNIIVNGESGTYNYTINVNAIGGIFNIIVVDSRNYSSFIQVEKNLIEYQPIKINLFSFIRENSTSSNIILNLESRYYQTTGITNTPVVKWKLNEEGTYTTIPSTEYSIDTTNNKLTISNYEITNVLPYTQSGKFYVSVEDIFTSDSNNEDVTKGIPTFDYGEHDLQVNGDLYIADTNRENKVNVGNGIIIATGNDYVKFADGTLVCYGETISGNVSGYSSSTMQISFSVSFVNSSYKVICQLTGGGAYWSWIVSNVRNRTTTGANIDLYNNNSNTAENISCTWIAVGKWK